MDINPKLIFEKWNPTFNDSKYKKITNERVKKATALMLENQVKYLNENGYFGNSLLNEVNDTQSSLNRSNYATSGDFQKLAMPMVRRTFPNLIAHEVVGVQPMAGPVGIAFALRFKALQTYNAPSIGGNHIPSNELGYNNIDAAYSGSMPTLSAEGLGSNVDPNLATAPQTNHGLGIGTGVTANEIGFTIEKQQVEAQSRKLRSRWSLEVAQDIKAMHGLDLEEEMMDILAYEITAEIDREIVQALRTSANNNKNSNVEGKKGVVDWTQTTQLDGRWEHEKYKNIYNLLVRKANRIAIDTRRGPGNFIIANPTIAAALEGTASFTIAPVASDLDTGAQGVTYLGTMDGRLKVFLDTFCSDDEALVGFKGVSPYDAGIIYLPYVQLLMSKATLEDSFNPTIGLMSRYAILQNLFGASNYYIRTKFINMP